jgi:hypothetical protein
MHSYYTGSFAATADKRTLIELASSLTINNLLNFLNLMTSQTHLQICDAVEARPFNNEHAVSSAAGGSPRLNHSMLTGLLGITGKQRCRGLQQQGETVERSQVLQMHERD